MKFTCLCGLFDVFFFCTASKFISFLALINDVLWLVTATKNVSKYLGNQQKYTENSSCKLSSSHKNNRMENEGKMRDRYKKNCSVGHWEVEMENVVGLKRKRPQKRDIIRGLWGRGSAKGSPFRPHNSFRDGSKPAILRFISLHLKTLGRFCSNCTKQ